MPDTTKEVKAILARTLRDLEQVIENANIASLLRGLGNVLGLEDNATAPTSRPTSRRATTAKPKRVTASRASTARGARPPQTNKTAEAKARTRTPAKPKAASTPHASSGAPRPRTGARRDQLLALVIEQPGITLAKAAKQFGLKDATGLYAVARRLQDDGLVRKTGVELHPTTKAQSK
jgi:transcriptional regulator with GAF, ATPase, and Fis domain